MRRATTIVALLLTSLLPTLGVAETLTVSIAVVVQGDSRPVVIGQTNLPEGTKLMVTISRSAASYMAQAGAVVVRGSFRAGPFTQDGSRLNPGIYSVEVTSPMAALQPDYVRAVIGESGENMQGPTVQESQFGGKDIDYSTEFKVGSGVASAAQDQAARNAERQQLHQWWLKSCHSTCDLVKAYATQRGELFDQQSCVQKCQNDEPKN